MFRSAAIDRVYTRPGISFGALPTSVWVRSALGLPDPQPGQPLAAYTAPTTRLSWFCVALTLLAGPAMRLAEAAAAQLHDPAAYLGAVLHGQEGTK